ncbi:hypothetical protein ALI144C_16935 [Actinosynnema sp. ALI-1.44]|uniref:helix-turn-helix domain-containing protein n=1 Tax=Actinosynnema sp. ALI-1.44 TaxID=1933779 RepID=UPI00097BCB9A|nr:helix-turn-helix transcriptional regulator [Actinosynnema sp. ALI-1.44]ONI83183.1 hypothetical protein ALI144C_16935 [Actinosynnema sp. ALI-1.44]
MTSQPELNYHGRKLARVLKKLREQGSLTQEQAGERACIDPRKLGRLERRQLPTYHELITLLDAYGIPSCDHTPHLELWEQAKQRPWWQEFHPDDVRYVRLADYASRKIEYQLTQVPTLLHTEAHARWSIAKRCPSLVAKRVAFLMRQQQRLITPPVLRFHALIHESVLQQGLDRAQLAKLVECAELPNVTLQLVPQAFTDPELTSSVSLLSFDDPDEPDSVFTESVIGLQESHDPLHTGSTRRLLGNAAGHAMSPEASLTRLQAQIGRRTSDTVRAVECYAASRTRI